MGSVRIVERHDLISCERASRMAGVSRQTITGRILSGELGAEKVGQWYFPYRAEIEAFAKQRATAQSTRDRRSA